MWPGRREAAMWSAPIPSNPKYSVDMDQSTPQPPPIRMFISYAREDDEALNFADPLKKGIGQLVRATSGRPVEVFLDRDEIQLGENWSEVIDTAVRRSYFFIPVYTGTYLHRPKCREEFLLFREVAESRGVPSLIIPINLLGMESLRPEGEDEISNYVRAHQAVIFDQAWEQGPESAPYRRALRLMANRILGAVPMVDAALALAEAVEADGRQPRRAEPITIDAQVPDPAEPENSMDEEDEETDLLTLSSAIEGNLEEITKAASALGPAIEDLGRFEQASEKHMQSPRNANKYLIRVANDMKQPALEIQAQGSNILRHTRKCDLDLRALVGWSDNLTCPCSRSLFTSHWHPESARLRRWVR